MTRKVLIRRKTTNQPTNQSVASGNFYKDQSEVPVQSV